MTSALSMIRPHPLYTRCGQGPYSSHDRCPLTAILEQLEKSYFAEIEVVAAPRWMGVDRGLPRMEASTVLSQRLGRVQPVLTNELPSPYRGPTSSSTSSSLTVSVVLSSSSPASCMGSMFIFDRTRILALSLSRGVPGNDQGIGDSSGGDRVSGIG